MAVLFTIFLTVQASLTTGILIDGKSPQSLVLSIEESLEEPSSSGNADEVKGRYKRGAESLELIQFRVDAKIKYRYSQTHVTSHVRNPDERHAQEVQFQVILPETAFISRFIMEIDHHLYEAYVKEKEEAKADYNQAKNLGHSAGLLELNARHANVFNVNVNIKAGSIVWFNLTYEELLNRRFGRYEQVITMNGDEISKNNDVELVVEIEESQDLVNVKGMNLNNELEATENSKSTAKVDKPSRNQARIAWSPSSKKEVLKRFIIQYDVKREVDSGEVLIMNGYFVHFFAPPKLKPLQKHVVFVLDVSGSMSGRKIEQLKEAMREILKDLGEKDYLNIVIFSDTVTMWYPGDRYQHLYKPGRFIEVEGRSSFHEPFPASSKNLKEANSYIDSLVASGGTNINEALVQALNLTAAVRRTREEMKDRKLKDDSSVLPQRVETMILFLTDGEPTTGETNLDKIQKNVQLANLGLSVPVFSLAFGAGADFALLRKLSLQNHAFARKIYEAADAALQLQGIYAEISSPLLSNVEFNYTSPETNYEVTEITRRKFPTYFDGWEFAVAGRIETGSKPVRPALDSTDAVVPEPQKKMAMTLYPYWPTDHCYFHTDISGTGYDGVHYWHRPLIYVRRPPWWCYPHPLPAPITTTTLRPATDEETFLERLWAYLTIQNLIEKDLAGTPSPTGETPKQKALRLALHYKFVTAQTSLVVVKPDSVDVTEAESADKKRFGMGMASGGAAGGSGGSGLHHVKKSSRPSTMFMKGGADTQMTTLMSAPMAPQMSTMALSPDSEVSVFADDAEHAHQTTTTTTSVKRKETKKPKPKANSAETYTLADIKWLVGDQVAIDTEEVGTRIYKVAKTGKEMSNSNLGGECVLGKHKGSKLNKNQGRCEHLSKCVRMEFLDDKEVYEKNYFCPIESTTSSDFYLGVCCVE